jgi:hypothetical protein
MGARLVFMAMAILGSGGAAWCLVRQDPEPVQPSNRPFMQAKLDHAQSIVEGLALENYDIIRTNAERLSLYSLESAWNVIQAPEYLSMSSEFRGSTQRLQEAAQAKNIDGATLAWFEVCLNCVRCHKYLRQKTQVGGNDKGP